MPTFIAGILALYLLLVGDAEVRPQLTPAAAVAMVRNGGCGRRSSCVAGFLLLRGNVTGAIAVAGVAASFGLIGRGGRLAPRVRRGGLRAAARAGDDGALGDDRDAARSETAAR